MMDEWIKCVYTYIMGYYSAIKRMKSCHLQHYKGYCAKWNKSDK